MTGTIFIRLLQSKDKAADLAAAVYNLREGQAQIGMVFEVDPHSFEQVPGSPFAYWVSDKLRGIFVRLPRFESNGRTAKVGLSTADDFRFVRTWWEVPPALVTHGTPEATAEGIRQQTFQGKRWVPFAKGGAYSPYFADLHLVIDWYLDGANLSAFRGSTIRNPDFYFRSGLTWSRRTQGGFSLRILPAGSIFADKGPAIFARTNSLPPILALTNSSSFAYLLSLQMAFGLYEVGVIQRTPIPDLNNAHGERLGKLATACIGLKRNLDTINDTSHVFILPALLQVEGDSLTKRADVWQSRVDEANRHLAEYQREIDDIAFRLYGIEGEDRRAIEESLAGGSRTVAEEGGAEQEGADEEEESVAEAETSADAERLTADLLSWAVGCAFGRWDVRLATGERPMPELPDPFAPLPVCSPGMLTGEDGLPLRQPPEGYPLKVDWDGILTDDPDHPDDIVRRVRDVLDLLWAERAEAIEREACHILGVKELRDYFRDPRRFWDDHVKRYSKSRRKAPIYWLLQSPKRNYALWLYYHRLDSDLLFKALVNYVEPKIRLEEGRLEALKAQRQAVGTAGKEARQMEKSIEKQEAVLADLREFRDRLERAAKLYITPDLNDGAVLNIAPLWELVPWKEAKAYWEDLLKGKYEWSSIGKQLREKRIV